MRVISLILLLCLIIGCNGSANDHITLPSLDEQIYKPGDSDLKVNDCGEGPFRLWGEWTFLIDKTHESIEVIPRRSPRMHLNATKFLEDYCADCIKIVSIHNNGDNTVDLTVRIRHPFPGFPEYTGFDVKGIIIFNGSLERNNPVHVCGMPDPYLISLKELGDPEVLNSDGYTPRWSPSYELTGDLPMFQYWEGKYASGVPNGGLNAYINFYTHEQRHYFSTNGEATKTYKIWLPPGEPVVAAYAIEACWEPPLVMPVTNPVTDFPASANQTEAFRLQMVINNGQEITDCDNWNSGEPCDNLYIEMQSWFEDWGVNFTVTWDINAPGGGGFVTGLCPGSDIKYKSIGLSPCLFENGIHRGVLSYINDMVDPPYSSCAWDFFEWSLNDPNN